MKRKSRASLITDARIAAADILADLDEGILLDQSFEYRTETLERRDRRWTQELVWGTLRKRAWLDAVIAERVRTGTARLDPHVVNLLRLGIYQLLFMNSVPTYAALAQTVEAAKAFKGRGVGNFVNAILRRVDRERDNLEPTLPRDTAEALALRHSHPHWLVERWLEHMPAEDVKALLEANNQSAPVVVRPWGLSATELAAALEQEGVATHPVTLLPDSLELAAGTQLSALDAYHDGHFFVQDPGATLVTRFAAFPPDALVADLCASPGGKALELSRTARMVLASDRSSNRVWWMLDGFERLGTDNIHAAVADATRPAISNVDCVLVDVPCSGTGTFRRHPDARWRLQPSGIAVLNALQREIITAAADAVHPGGLMVYSTCSLEQAENDEIVDMFLRSNPDWVEEPPPEGSVPSAVLDGKRLRTLPHRHNCDGAFAARLRKRS